MKSVHKVNKKLLLYENDFYGQFSEKPVRFEIRETGISMFHWTEIKHTE